MNVVVGRDAVFAEDFEPVRCCRLDRKNSTFV